jgi:demethylmenaquinone methyltransferase / 2-methoxy-6-polyprenyl-1,4-benzoquinol methylase
VKKHFDRLEETKKPKISAMFDSIAHRYDFLNHFLSAGIDKSWRKKAINEVARVSPSRILDVATGTGDLAFEALRLSPQKIVGIDISEGMLAVGRKKVEAAGKSNIIDLQVGDSLNIQFADNSFDAAMVAFGVRNFEDLERGLAEMYRVLVPGGRIVVLEFSQPQNFLIRAFYNFYSFTVMPFFGRLFSDDKSAYSYLPASVKAFPSGNDFLAHLSNLGFVKVKFQPLTFGIATIYTGYK